MPLDMTIEHDRDTDTQLYSRGQKLVRNDDMLHTFMHRI